MTEGGRIFLHQEGLVKIKPNKGSDLPFSKLYTKNMFLCYQPSEADMCIKSNFHLGIKIRIVDHRTQ